jgi:PAS domain S-box-containing protein
MSHRGTEFPPTTAELDRLFRAHPEASELPVVVLDTHFRYLGANDAFVRSSGHSLDTLVGNSCESFTHPDDRDHEEASFNRLVSGELDFLDIRARRVLADGTHLEYASHRAAVRDPDATLQCVLAVARPMRPFADGERDHLPGSEPSGDDAGNSTTSSTHSRPASSRERSGAPPKPRSGAAA